MSAAIVSIANSWKLRNDEHAVHVKERYIRNSDMETFRNELTATESVRSEALMIFRNKLVFMVRGC
jgi:hypothetical protein